MKRIVALVLFVVGMVACGAPAVKEEPNWQAERDRAGQEQKDLDRNIPNE